MKRKVQFIARDDWLGRAVKSFPTAIEPFVLKGADNTKARVDATVSQYRDVTILEGDWLALTTDGKCALIGMVQSPAAYPECAKNLVRGLTGLETTAEESVILSVPCVLIGGSTDYQRWLLIFLPRLLLILKLGLLESRLVILNSDLQDFQREALDLLGIQARQRFSAPVRSAVFAHDALVPSMMAHTIVTHPCVPELLREAFPAKVGFAGKRIYFTRRSAQIDRLTNEDDLIGLVSKFGFEIHDASLMSFQEQIDLCASAGAICGVQGAELANVVFCNRGTVVIQIGTPKRPPTSLQLLASMLGHSMSFIPARESSGNGQDLASVAGLRVDLPALEAELMRRFPAL